MRTIKELLTITRNCIINDEPPLFLGLCWYVTLLHYEETITKEERDTLLGYFRSNTPLTYTVIMDKIFPDPRKHAFWWGGRK